MLISGDTRSFTTTVRKALHEIRTDWMDLPGLVVCGAHNPQNTEEELERIRKAREEDIPTIGICMGMQLMAMEYGRNVLGIEAEHEELNPHAKKPAIYKLDSIRCGIFPVKGRMESHWHQYALSDWFADCLEPEWEVLREGEIVEYIKLSNRKHFIGCQYHPEYQSNSFRPHPLLMEFIAECEI